MVRPSIQLHDNHDVEAVMSTYSSPIELILGFERIYLPVIMCNY